MIKLEKLNNDGKEEKQFKTEITDLIYFAKKHDDDKVSLMVESISGRFATRCVGADGMTLDPMTFKPIKKCLLAVDLEEIQDGISMNGKEETAKKIGIEILDGIRSL